MKVLVRDKVQGKGRLSTCLLSILVNFALWKVIFRLEIGAETFSKYALQDGKRHSGHLGGLNMKRLCRHCEWNVGFAEHGVALPAQLTVDLASHS